MKLIKTFIIVAIISIAGLIYIAPDQASTQDDLYLNRDQSPEAYRLLSVMVDEVFFVVPIISQSAEKTIARLDSSYFSIGFESNFESVLNQNENRFSHGDHFVVPMSLAKNNVCFISDDKKLAESFLSKPGGPWSFDERMIIHELSHCQYKFNAGQHASFDEDIESIFAEYLLMGSVDRTDGFRATATGLKDDYIDLYHEIYADLFTIAYFMSVKGDLATPIDIAKYRNQSLLGSRDVIHWTSPHIKPFIAAYKPIRNTMGSFADIDQHVRDYVTGNVHVFGPDKFLDLMVVIGRSEIEKRSVLEFSDFDGKDELKQWVANVFQNSEI